MASLAQFLASPLKPVSATTLWSPGLPICHDLPNLVLKIVVVEAICNLELIAGGPKAEPRRSLGDAGYCGYQSMHLDSINNAMV